MESYNVVVFGAGNQKLYVNKLKIPNKFGGEPPYGGSAMAMEFAKAGHDVILAEPHKNMLSDEQWQKVENAGVKLSSDDIEVAKHAEIAIFFTPYGSKTTNIVKKIAEYLPKNAVLCNTCTISPVVAYSLLEQLLKVKRKDIGISSMHPMGVPGTDLQKSYIISKECTNGEVYATEEQINKLINLVKSVGKTPNVVYADVLSSIADVCSMITAITMAGITEYFKYCVPEMNMPKEMAEQQILISLNTISAIVESSGVEGLFSGINSSILLDSAKSMKIHENQKLLSSAFEILENDADMIKPGVVNSSYLLPSQAVVEDVKKIAGDAVANGIIKRSIRKLFEQKN